MKLVKLKQFKDLISGNYVQISHYLLKNLKKIVLE